VYFAEQPPCGKFDPATNSCLYNDSWIGTESCQFHRECTSNQTKYVSIFASSYWAAVRTIVDSKGPEAIFKLQVIFIYDSGTDLK
jgi:hypothetical protein